MRTRSPKNPEKDALIVRLNCRIHSAIKERAEQAAALTGQSITAFTEAALSEKAEEVIAQSTRIQLSQRDFDLFVSALDSPAEPTDALKRDAEKYKQLRSSGKGW